MLQLGDVVTIPASLVGGDGLAVGKGLKLAEGGKLAVANEGDVIIAKVEALEDIIVPMYAGQWGYNTKVEDVKQASVVIRIA